MIKLFSITVGNFLIVSSCHVRYAFRDSLTDVVVQHLTTQDRGNHLTDMSTTVR